jgi:hypothetical protein
MRLSAAHPARARQCAGENQKQRRHPAQHPHLQRKEFAHQPCTAEVQEDHRREVFRATVG